ncbi:UNVERIFIED_CONTAM: hypothetical protein Sangu_0226300 [Sesamum angustifolium]|uniref:Uncharacterized protein n=1 Tax=Sesamum angustifolium TaxID=2727405 RepID=A0AAW2RN05_9LAMI
MGDNSPEKKSGCGLLTAVFGGRGSWTRKLPSSGSVEASNAKNVARSPDIAVPNTQKVGHNVEVLDSSNGKDRIISRPGQNYSKPVYQQHQPPSARQQNQEAAAGQTGHGQVRKAPQAVVEISGELESMISDHQKSKGAGSLVRASSSNVMLYGNLGNLRQPGDTDNENVLDYLPRTANEEPLPINGKYSPMPRMWP